MKFKTSRRVIREKALRILYAYELNSEGLQALLDSHFTDQDPEEERKFGIELVNRTIIRRKECDKEIESRLSNWELKRVAIIDRILLRMGMTEILSFPEIPPKVTINEVIEISKDYSTAGSGKFINGLLDAYLNTLKDSGLLKKSGRGLLEEKIPDNPES